MYIFFSNKLYEDLCKTKNSIAGKNRKEKSAQALTSEQRDNFN